MTPDSFLKEDNICKFTNKTKAEAELAAFQFIYETMPHRLGNPRTCPSFSCCLMTQGTALLETEHGQFSLTPGDVFFTFPATPFSIRNCNQTRYYYISFVGSRANYYLESAGITPSSPVRSGFEELRSTFSYGIAKTTEANLPILTKGVLLYTLSVISAPDDSAARIEEKSLVEQIRGDIESCYAETELSLENLCDRRKYSSKYVSRRFREEMGISFSEYLQSCRIHHACNLLRGTNRSIQEIALSVGYRDSLYFSKVFKKCMGVSPSGYRNGGGE
ncbi:MAG: AraC family transcriptional regulator [Ruminococcaceae bacterium]|nr:AraC family transcriptional regulator [Oscillospiraceae bacterium]